MIVLNLCCGQGHRFDGWFKSADEFSRQNEEGKVACPVCSDGQIARLPSAPRVRRSRAAAPVPETTSGSPAPQDLHALRQVLQKIFRDAEDVGASFAEEARKIHYDEAPQRTIRGMATREETKDLLEEGIAVLPLPSPPPGDVH